MNHAPAALALIACLALQDQDVVRLKDGTTRTGRIASETNQEVVIETLIKGSKGEIIGSGRVTVLRSEIESIERASEAARLKAAERSKTFGERGLRRAEALSRIRTEASTLDGAASLRVEGTSFSLESTCDPNFVKEMAYYLDDIFGAYRRHLGVRRNASRRIKVYLLSDREEYARFQDRRYGGAVLNPAHYNTKENFIAAFNMIQKDEERRVRAEIRRVQGLIETLKTNVASESARINRLAKEIRQKIVDAAAEARRILNMQRPPDLADRLRQVDQWEKEKREGLKTEEAALQKELEDIRKKATADIEQSRKVLEHNERVLVNQNRQMMEMLFHEGFHAYAANFLWEGGESVKCPRWLHEGMATYFEMSVVEGGELVYGALHPGFAALLKEQLPRAALPRLEDLLKGGAEHFVVVNKDDKAQALRSTVNYAYCWLMAHHLAGKVSAEQVQAYIGEVIRGDDAVQAFEKLAGKKVREVESELRSKILAFK